MSTPTVACWSCGRDNAVGRDFCEHCGEYLSWAPTGYIPAVGAEGNGHHEDAEQPETVELQAAPPDGGEVVPILASVPQPGLPDLPAATGDASLAMHPTDPGSIGAADVASVEAGHAIAFIATIRNDSRLVDNFELAVAGLPDGWTTISPATAYLVPLGVGGESAQEIRIDLSPPREPTSTAGIWTFELVATSRATGLVAARAATQFEVKPFAAWSTEVTPTMRAGRLRARYRVAVRNDGNAPVDLTLVAMDDEGRLRTRFKAGRLQLHPSEVGVDELTLRPPYPLPTGRRSDHRATVDAYPTLPEAPEEDAEESKLKGMGGKLGKEAGLDVGKGGVKVKKPRLRMPRFKPPQLKLDAASLAQLKSDRAVADVAVTGRPVIYRQKPLVPLWLIALLLVLAAIGAAVYLLLPKKVDVPQLVGVRDAFTADKLLRKKGLVLAQPVQQRKDPNAPPGSVVGQSPVPGKSVEEGETVAIEVASGSTTVEVPRLKGLTRVKADERLRGDQLSLGNAEPADAPDKWVVRSQVPRPGLSVATGTPVQVFLTRPPKKKKKGGEDADKGKAGAGAGAKGKPVVIPAIDDMPLPDYREALEKLKLKVEVTRVISAKKKDTVLAVDPEPGAEAKTGDTVNVRASVGAPDLAVETEGLIQRVDPRNGQERGRIPNGEGTAVEPSFTPDGKQILYRSDNTLKLSALTDGAKPRTVYDGGDPVRLPVIASNGEAVAMLRRLEEDGDLCLGRIRHPRMKVLCLADDGWDLFGRPAWRKDGKQLIVPSAKQGDPKTFALRVYETSHPFSINPANWAGRVATDVTVPGKGVIAAAFSPDGEKLAAVTNLVSGRFEIVTAGADDVELADPKSTGVAACDLAWRSDSKEMAFVEGGAACAAPSGKVQRFLLTKPRDATRVVDDGRHPAYRPIEIDD